MRIAQVAPLAWLVAGLLDCSIVVAADTGGIDECGYRPSFNCALADDDISREICVKPELITLDCALGYAYRDARKAAGEDIVRIGQLSWIKARKNQCERQSGPALVSCILTTTIERLKILIEQYHLPVAGKVYQRFTAAKGELP